MSAPNIRMKACIVNVAIGAWYPQGQARLAESLKKHSPDVGTMFWTDQVPAGSPTHEESHKQFKLWAVLAAAKAGYDIVVWADASVWLIKPATPLLDRIAKDGFWWMCGNHKIGVWATDRQLEILGYNRDEAMHRHQIVGGMWGVDFRTDVGKSIINFVKDHREAFGNEWDEPGYLDGLARGSQDPRVHGHRHDNIILGAAAHQLGLPCDPHPSYLEVCPKKRVPMVKPHVIAVANGI